MPQSQKNKVKNRVAVEKMPNWYHVFVDYVVFRT